MTNNLIEKLRHESSRWFLTSIAGLVAFPALTAKAHVSGFEQVCKTNTRTETVRVERPNGSCSRQVGWMVKPFEGALPVENPEDFFHYMIREFGIGAGNGVAPADLISGYKFSPDGRKVAFQYSSRRHKIGNNIAPQAVLLDLASGQVKVISYHDALQRTPYSSRFESFTKDGKGVIFTSLDYRFALENARFLRQRANNPGVNRADPFMDPDMVGIYDIEQGQLDYKSIRLISPFAELSAPLTVPESIAARFDPLPTHFKKLLQSENCTTCEYPVWVSLHDVTESYGHHRAVVIYDLAKEIRTILDDTYFREQFNDPGLDSRTQLFLSEDGATIFLKSATKGRIYSYHIPTSSAELANVPADGTPPRSRVLGVGFFGSHRYMAYTSYNEAGYPLYGMPLLSDLINRGQLEKTDSVIWIKDLKTKTLSAVVHKYSYHKHWRWEAWHKDEN